MSNSETVSKPLRIALVGPAHPLRGGIADFNEALARSLQQSGHSVSIFSFYLQYPGLLFPGKSQFSDSVAPAELDIRPTISSINPLSWVRTAKQILAGKPDLVIMRYWLPFMGPALGTVARKIRKGGVPVIAITDNVIPHEKRPGDNAFTRYFVNSCDGFVSMSRSVLSDLSKFTGNPRKLFQPHPVYNIFGEGVSKMEARKKLSVPIEERLILFFGFIRHYKGLGLLLESMADQRLRDLKVKLIVAGEFYEDEKFYRDLVKSLKIESSVRFDSSFIPKDSVKDYFCATDLVVQPYLNATQSGITQIAYYFGRPMLVTNVGGLAEIVEDGKAGYVVSSNAVSIADAIYDFYLHGREEAFARNVIAARARFEWPAFVDGLIQFYEKIRSGT